MTWYTKAQADHDDEMRRNAAEARPMTTDETMDALIDARRAWEEWQEAWRQLKDAMRAADISTIRLEAYQVGTGYDEGGGQSLDGWLDEVEQQIDQAYADASTARILAERP